MSILLNYEDFKKNYNGLDMLGDPKNPRTSSKRVNSIYQKQKNNITDQINQKQNDIEDSTDNIYTYKICFFVFLGLCVISALCALLTYYKQKKYEDEAQNLQNERKQL